MQGGGLPLSTVQCGSTQDSSLAVPYQLFFDVFFPMRLSIFLIALLLTGLTYAQEGDASVPDNSDSGEGVNPNSPPSTIDGESGEGDEESDATGVDPAVQAQQEREAQQQQLQQFYVQFLLKRGSPLCKGELETVLQNPPEEAQTKSPFSKECDKEFKGVSFLHDYLFAAASYLIIFCAFTSWYFLIVPHSYLSFIPLFSFALLASKEVPVFFKQR